MKTKTTTYRLQLSSYIPREGTATFLIVRNDRRRTVLQQEVRVTGDLKADAAKAARWAMSTLQGRNLANPVKGTLRYRGTACELPSEAFAAYGITRETCPTGSVSVEVPYWDIEVAA